MTSNDLPHQVVRMRLTVVTGGVTGTTGVVKGTTGVVTGTTGVVKGTTGVVTGTTGVVTGTPGVVPGTYGVVPGAIASSSSKTLFGCISLSSARRPLEERPRWRSAAARPSPRRRLSQGHPPCRLCRAECKSRLRSSISCTSSRCC